jgi:hypothetical protein
MTLDPIVRLKASLASWLPNNDYLSEPSPLPSLSLLFLMLPIFRFVPLGFPMAIIGYLALALIIISLLRPTRRTMYLALVAAFVVIAIVMVFSVSTGPQDRLSDRDDAAEIAASRLWLLQNPWSVKSILGLPITTGPTGILLSAFSVLFTGHINLVTFVFWGAFVAILLAGDLKNRNRSFALLLPLLFVPELAVIHTFFWSLEELYFPLVFIALSAWALTRSSYFGAGACAACVVLGRLNYSLAMAGLFFWMVSSRERPLGPALQFAGGAISATIFLLLPFLFVPGPSLIRDNFVTIGIQTAKSVNAASTAFSWINPSNSLLNTLLLGCALLLTLFIVARFTAHRTPHPFWHVAAGSLMTQLTLFSPMAPNDYLLMVMGPALFAVAFTPSQRPANLSTVSSF